MDIARVIERLGLKSNLEAATAHPEMHAVHVDASRIRLIIRGLNQVCFLILVNWNKDLDFLTSSLSDRLH